jgi:uncharacterized membrane protein HdeD (DUF308 family)
MPTDSDYVIFVALLLAVLGAGVLRVGLMNLKSEPRKGRLFIALGSAFGIAAALILVLRAVKIGG